MLSRVANSIYWMSRYVERAENAARLIDVNLQLQLDRTSHDEEQWMPLISITGDQEMFDATGRKPTRSNVMYFLTLDRSYPNSIASCIAAARENARTVRDVITSEMWQQINTVYIMMMRATGSQRFETQPHEFYTTLRLACQLFDAVTDGTMSHGVGWDFARLGRMMERADQTSRILDVKYFLLLPNPDEIGGALDVVQWAALLRSAGALEMYRQAYGTIEPAHVASFLVLDPAFPRSLAHCVARAEKSLSHIVGPNRSPATDEAARRLGRLRAELQFGDIEEIVHTGMHDYLDETQKKLNDVDESINRAFFGAMAPAPV